MALIFFSFTYFSHRQLLLSPKRRRWNCEIPRARNLTRGEISDKGTNRTRAMSETSVRFFFHCVRALLARSQVGPLVVQVRRFLLSATLTSPCHSSPAALDVPVWSWLYIVLLVCLYLTSPRLLSSQPLRPVTPHPRGSVRRGSKPIVASAAGVLAGGRHGRANDFSSRPSRRRESSSKIAFGPRSRNHEPPVRILRNCTLAILPPPLPLASPPLASGPWKKESPRRVNADERRSRTR